MPAHSDHTAIDVLLMHSDDSVLMAATDLPAGHVTHAAGAPLTLLEPIPSGHKLSRRPIAAGEIIVKYGQPIGLSTECIPAGAHVHVHNLESLRGRGDLGTRLEPQRPSSRVAAHANPSPQIALPAGLTFPGYRRPDGRAGVRNHVLVLASVQCANAAVRRIARLVPEVVPLTHIYGCSQLGADLAQTARTLEEFASHPNVAAVLLVGLGCETLDTPALAERLAAVGVMVQRLSIQDEGGTGATAERGAAIVRELLTGASCARRESIPISELVVGVECGGSDAWSGLTANPALGLASDALVRAGGTVILSETPEFIGAEHLLAARAVPALGEAIRAAVARWEDVARRLGVDMRGAQPTPGNQAGGLTTIEEKSLGAIAKGGSSLVQEMIGYACRPSRHGLILMDTAGNDPESVTGEVAGGAQIVIFTTGRGSPVGCPIAPVIKVASNSVVARRMSEDIDLDAGVIVSAGASPAAVGRQIIDAILSVAGGAETAAERSGCGEFSIGALGNRI